MTELLKINMVLKSIIELCNKTTTGNVAHNVNTIKFQAEYAQEQLEKINELENGIKRESDCYQPVDKLDTSNPPKFN